jgi:ribonuclease HII
VVVSCTDIDAYGLHRCNVAALRRALWRLEVRPDYVLTDGFPVTGLGVPGLAMWKGDQVAACIAAASVVAKVTRDRLMVALHDEFPAYNFAQHKGYATPEHRAALRSHGPCSQHRRSFAGVGDDGYDDLLLEEACE